MRKNIRKNKLLIKLILITIISILLGILFMAIIKENNKVLVKDNLKLYFASLHKLNYLKALLTCSTSNTIYIIIIWLLGISIIGIPIIIIMLLFKGFILGFSISSILYFYKFKGILICLIYIILFVIFL